ncbi:anthranilate phosphoribosyltransferase [Candidatus Pantoea carbekii]|uniref:Anthranilate phosphoribosyltransferase n=1 Tax=Candidatus Pantoea carbekii TaxID=1235990 RepID=U3U803_9GAMM|nr:anthranilate phosphoribosyltransferase [Candidatus Pantoea carbekii]
MLQSILNKLYQCNSLSQSETYYLFKIIISGKLEPIQIAAALIAMKVRGENPEEIAGAASALLKHVKPFPRPDYIFADIVGSGGDHSNSINISTPSAFVAACCGMKIAKHNNRSISSKSGSSDLLEAFGINLDISPKQARQALDDLNVCFLFAPKYHAGFIHATPVRNKLKTPTMFNLIAPLINPAKPPLAMIGVYSPNLVLPIAETLKILGTYHRAIVVHGGGMDKVVLHSPTQVAELHNGKITTYQLNQEDFGFRAQNKKALQAGSTEKNRDILMRVLKGKGKLAHEQVIAVNVAMLLKIFGNEDLYDNAQYALEVIRSGQAYKRIIALAARG